MRPPTTPAAVQPVTTLSGRSNDLARCGHENFSAVVLSTSRNDPRSSRMMSSHRVAITKRHLLGGGKDMFRFVTVPLIQALPQRGDRERDVRASLLTRPAGVLSGLDPIALACFLQLAREEASHQGELDRQDRLSIGCLACETDWRKTWSALAKLGLITYKQSLTRNDRSGRLATLRYWVTVLGFQAHADHLRWTAELASAMDADQSDTRNEQPRDSARPRAIATRNGRLRTS
jgi:hypothetical protein